MVNQANGAAPPGAAPPPGMEWLANVFGGLQSLAQNGLVSPQQMLASVQQLNHNLEMLQGGLATVDRLNDNLESMAPDIRKLTAALTGLAEHIWGPPS